MSFDDYWEPFRGAPKWLEAMCKHAFLAGHLESLKELEPRSAARIKSIEERLENVKDDRTTAGGYSQERT